MKKNRLFLSQAAALAVFVIAALLVWLWPKPSSKPAPIVAGENGKNAPARIPSPARNTDAPPASLVPPEPVVEKVSEDGKSERRAYRLAVRGGVVSLAGVETITGNFNTRRGPQPWMPGMWCVRLLDENMRVLAEETANAPDAVCVVLDASIRGADGQPQAIQYSGAGGDAMFQARLTPHPAAKWLKVYRISSMQRADWNMEPGGNLLATIPLP